MSAKSCDHLRFLLFCITGNTSTAICFNTPAMTHRPTRFVVSIYLGNIDYKKRLCIFLDKKCIYIYIYRYRYFFLHLSSRTSGVDETAGVRKVDDVASSL